jgi:hypothetical protein
VSTPTSTGTPASPASAVRQVGESELRGLLGQVASDVGQSRPAADPAASGDGSAPGVSDRCRLVLVAAAPQWDGPPVLESDLGPVRVVVGASPLAVRIAMVDHPDEFLAVLTSLTREELGEEVIARAWRHSVRRPSAWDAVTSLFKVTQLDPSLRTDAWMVDLLVRLAPPGGYRQPSSGLLDRATAWRTLYRHGLGLEAAEPAPQELLAWASDPSTRERLARLDASARERVSERLSIDVGPAATALLRLAADGRGDDLVPLGLVVDALWPSPDPVVRIRLEERHLDRQPLTDAAARDWAAAARTRFAGFGQGPTATLERAESILADLDPEGTADSDVLPSGFRRRLSQLGAALLSTLDDAASGLQAAEGALATVRAHAMAGAAPDRIGAAEAAVRLCRRRAAGVGAASEGDLQALTRDYLDDGAWVDAARHRIAEGETVDTLVAAYRRLADTVDDERRDRDRRYATRVAAEATATAPPPSLDSQRPLRIEDVLGTVLTPLAGDRPVLLLVIDGLAHAAVPPFLDDLEVDGWQTHGPGGRAVPGVIAALPTVTIVSRASLLAGAITTGGQDVERDGFCQHGQLLAVTGGQPPLLFHKRDLRTHDGEIAPGPREAIADPANRVVGVVVNAADDHLAKGDQLRLADGLDGIPVLRPLLQEALTAGRVVVLTSDHGHILGSHQRVVSAGGGGGERFRLDDGREAADDEVRLEGARVVSPGGAVGGPLVAGADDGVRYNAVAKHGYHGGVTPAEVLCPLLVLTAGDVELAGWSPRPIDVPSWWAPDQAPLAGEELSAVAAPPAPREVRAEAPQLSLLEPDPVPSPPAPAAASAPGWAEQLLASPRLADQKRLAGRARLDDQELARLVRLLVAAGGTASGAALQRTLELPATRLRGKLEAARSLLDVDGYAILRIEADSTATLNTLLLAEQFEIDVPEPTS